MFFTAGKKDSSYLLTEDIVICGLMFVTVYAQFFSLFSGVGLGAHILLYVLDLILLFFIFKNKDFKDFAKSLPDVRIRHFLPAVILVLISVVVMAFGSSHGYMHYDSDLYHAQSIRWIEEYGVIKGLGNLHGRLAYNSSSFALSALYSFSFLGKQSFHACAGFLALIVFISSLRFLHIFSDRKVKISDFVRLASLYYVLNIYDEMVSPASDYFVMLLFLYIVVRISDIYESRSADVWAVFSMISVFLATVKFSAAGIVIICIVPVIYLIKEKRLLKILSYFILGFIIALPYFIRNYFISGWLLYPSTFIDIFSPVWKIPAESADIDSSYIIAFGRGFSSMDASELSVSQWFPHWFSLLGRTEKVLILSCFLSLIIFVVMIVIERKKYELYLAELSVIIVFFMWLLSSPLVRYGQGIILALPFFVFGHLFVFITESFGKKITAYRVMNFFAMIMFTLFIVYKGVFLIKYIYSDIRLPYYVNQQDYGKYETVSYDIDGVRIYAPVSGDRTGYDCFPSTPEINNYIRLMGNELDEGFMRR